MNNSLKVSSSVFKEKLDAVDQTREAVQAELGSSLETTFSETLVDCLPIFVVTGAQ